MNLEKTNAYIRQHGKVLPNGQVMLTSPLFVFKKVKVRSGRSYGVHSNYREDAIANLVIPVGAVVNLAQSYEKKLRATQAYCHSIVSVNGRTRYETAYSTHDSYFTYTSGMMHGNKALKKKDFLNMVSDAEEYEPDTTKSAALSACKVEPGSFNSTTTRECASGVHFFLELSLAKQY